jgi:hypothetical protein
MSRSRKARLLCMLRIRPLHARSLASLRPKKSISQNDRLMMAMLSRDAELAHDAREALTNIYDKLPGMGASCV